MITTNEDKEIELTVADKKFVDLINNRITAYGQIPYTVPTKLIIDVIKQSARFFFKWYISASSRVFYRLTPEDYLEYTKNYNSQIPGEVGYFLTLPSYIINVWEIYETDRTTFAASKPIDYYTYNRSPYLSMRGINMDLYVIESACRIIEENALKTVFGRPFPFNYNNLIHRLMLGESFDKNLILDCSANIDIQKLYNDNYFIRHVLGCTKRELKRIIGGHTKPLNGGVTLNPDEICNDLDDIGKVEDLIKASSTMGDVIIWND